ncbi:hypothetical protein QBC47DRAFT_297930 [Echria macrotheca]|uniref:DUF6594 domain-containing protein n=1 Tax=Echria macrotheca TaxID=438768 RepID=A0AAJ0BJL7_9PEZI|nr:hypothetical protein QBC47DRAFT_297930 [Echria macrotheca]
MVRNTSPPAIKPSAPVKPDALSFLDPDSPPVTEEHLRRVIAESSAMWSPRSASSSSSSTNSDSASESHRSMAETDATTPDQSVNGDATPQSRGDSPNRPSRSPTQPPGPLSTEAKEHKYGTPEMARGPAKHPHLPPKDLQPRISAPGQGHAKHLPRAEKLPMSGYELLAAKLSSPDSSRSRRRSYSSNKTPSTEETETAQIRPIYRRFETLNHRLLLHLQDELSELEEQLHRLDTADTQTRRLANCILPASRRAEFMAGGELQWHRTDILGKIGFKLGQYNHVLTTFKETQSLPSASLSDIETYRTYLATQNPIAEIETRFLDPADDLVCLAQVSRGGRASTSSCSSSGSTEDMLTPMPLKMTFGFSEREPSPTAGSGSGSGSGSSRKSSFGFGTSPSPTTRYQSAGERKGEEDVSGKEEVVEDRLQEGGKVGRGRKGPGPGPAGQLAGLAALAIVAPILAFPLVADFVGRMAVVLVVGLAVAALRRKMVDSGLLLGGEVSGRPTEVVVENEGMVLVGVYAGVMAVIALLF